MVVVASSLASDTTPLTMDLKNPRHPLASTVLPDEVLPLGNPTSKPLTPSGAGSYATYEEENNGFENQQITQIQYY